MPGQPRRGSRPTPGVGIRPAGRLRNSPRGATARNNPEPASQPRPIRLGTPVGTSTRGTGRPRANPARSGARPGAVRRPSATGRSRGTQPNRFTGRATVLGLVLGALLLAYAYPVRIYLNQQSEIDALRDHQRAQQQHIAGLQAESDKWNDPTYVASQACSRLHMCKPGDTLYIVVGGDQAGSAPTNAASTNGPWYDQLWSSVTSADQPGK
jgi:cell division protein FtsB